MARTSSSRSIACQAREHFLKMEGRDVFRFATQAIPGSRVQVVFGPGNVMFAGCADLVVKWTLEHRSENPGIRDGDVFLVSAPPETLTAVREAIEAAGFTVRTAELSMIPKTTVEVAEESSAKKVVRLIEALEENDDVQDVWANFDIPEQVLEAVAS